MNPLAWLHLWLCALLFLATEIWFGLLLCNGPQSVLESFLVVVAAEFTRGLAEGGSLFFIIRLRLDLLQHAEGLHRRLVQS